LRATGRYDTGTEDPCTGIENASLLPSPRNDDEARPRIGNNPVTEKEDSTKEPDECTSSPFVLQKPTLLLEVKARELLPADYCFGPETSHFTGNRALERLALSTMTLSVLLAQAPRAPNEDFLIAEKVVEKWRCARGHFL